MPIEVDLEELGRVLRDRRDVMGRTRDEIAALTGVTPQYLYMVEQRRPREQGGRSARPRRETLIRWASALDMDLPATNHVLALAGYGPVSPSERAADQILRRSHRTPSRPTSGRQTEQLLAEVEHVLQLVPEEDRRWQETADLLRSVLAYAEGRLRDFAESRLHREEP